ncbi:hypothetical protein MAM1_0801d11254 [Mucor ambiguus]|uniref:Uncharacterized protein n=1 Tax=Mucor ambiguus TaxID=91626 RepID=A0A0C9NA75_9FUNG|nr:hypothetical protein MAM1_0801d11254 [Mucor ambiguus]
MLTDTSKIPAVIKSLRDETNQVNWAYFLLEAKTYILCSAPNFETRHQLKKFWLATAKDIASKEGCTLNLGADTWHIIEKALNDQPPQKPAMAILSSASSTSSSSTSFKKPQQRSTSTSSSSQSTESGSQSGTETQQSTVKLATLSDQDKINIRASYQKLDPSKMWKLSTGKIVEEQMSACALCKNQEHLSHSFIFNCQDKQWLKYFTEDEIQEIRDFRFPDLPPPPEDLQTYLDLLETMDSDELSNSIATNQFPLESDAKWAQDAYSQAVRLLRSGFFTKKKDITETQLLKRVWTCIDTCFDFSNITCISGEKCSTSSADAINASRSDLSSRQSSGRKMDYLFLDSYNEVGCGEAGLVGGANTTKELSDAMFKMPKVMKDMLIKLVAVSPALKNDLVITGLYIGEYKLKMFTLDCPTEYVTRYDAMDDVSFPSVESQLHRQLSATLQIIVGAKLMMETTAAKLAADKTKISVGRSKINTFGPMIPCFNPAPITRKRSIPNEEQLTIFQHVQLIYMYTGPDIDCTYWIYANVKRVIKVLGHVNIPLKIATNVSFKNENKGGDAVNTEVINDHAKQKATDNAALPPIAKYSHIRDLFSRTKSCFRPPE